jgi:creatinine amidohydrolase
VRLFTILSLAAAAASAQAPDTVFLEELTWTEVRDALEAGKTSIIVPTGGTEQNGPHMVLGKHNFRIRHNAGLIARKLGKTLVAPVMAYVPEGDLNPPTGHMRYPGTITLPDEYFRKVLEYAARSLQVHGFKDIVFIGDSGPNQPGMKAVSEQLNKEWASSGARVHFIPEYYRGNGFEEWLAKQGESKADIGTHAGIHDTSLLMAVDPKLVRKDKIAPGGGFAASGVVGNPARATAAFGKAGIEMIVDHTVKRIRESMQRRR